MICFLFFFFLSLLNLKIKMATHFSHSGIKKPFSEVALQTRESLKRPYFPLPLSILAGTNLIMLLSFFLQPPFDSQENSSLFDFREKPEKLLLFFCFFCFAPCVFWICSRGLFAFVPLDLNFTNLNPQFFMLMTGLTFIGMSATMESDILETTYMKRQRKRKETFLSW